MLTIASYDQAESEAVSRLSARAIAAFAPVTFAARNYPTRATQEKELARYIDTMHDTKAARYFDPTLHQFSTTEANEVRRVVDVVAQRTQEHFGRTIRPWMAPLAAVSMYRILSALLPGQRLAVFEIGPGSGYLGALLAAAGHRYLCMDNTQAFYLWQNRLFTWIAGSDYSDDDGTSSRIGHMPWWQFAGLREDTSVRVDVVVCDHALGEVSRDALSFILRAAEYMLAGGGRKYFLFESPGAQHSSTIDDICRSFFRAGYSLLVWKGFYAFAPNGSALHSLGIDEKLFFGMQLWKRLRRRNKEAEIRRTLGIPATLPCVGGTEASVPGGQIIALDTAEAPLDYEFLATCGYVVPSPARTK